jgi:hypothetical protein
MSISVDDDPSVDLYFDNDPATEFYDCPFGQDPCQLTCPPNIIINLDPGSCGQFVNFNVTTTGVCEIAPGVNAVVEQVSGLPSGSFFPIGITTNCFKVDLPPLNSPAEDLNCCFTVEVLEYPNPITSLICNDLVYVSLDASCSYCLGADDILEGGPYGCYDDFVVEVDKTPPFGNGPWLPACFNIADIDKTYQLRVTDLSTGNKCWGNVKIEDKLPPEMVCEDFSVPCNTPNFSPSYLLNVLGIAEAFPDVTDCQNFTLTWIDTETDQNCASGLTKIITRKWTAVDESGNSSTCIQQISLLRPTLNDLVLPPDYDGIDAPYFECASAYPTPDWIESQGLQGYPYVFGLPSGCSINWAYDDVLIEVCDGTYKIVREWTIVDWCTGIPFQHYQIIKVADEVGPTFDCPANLTVSTDPFACCATINLPDVIVEDNCSRINNISGMIVDARPIHG